MTSVRNFLRALFRHDAMNREMNDEMRAHLAQSTERLMARGMPRGEAELAARREFGNIGVLTEQGRDARGASWVESTRGDIRYALRALRQSPTFALVAILSLGIGIGANTAIFSLINAVMLRPLPVDRPREIVTIGTTDGALAFSNPLYEALRDRFGDIGTVAASGGASFNLANGGEERLVGGELVSGTYFSTLAVRPAAGRLLMPADDRRGCAPVAVVSHRFWRGELGGRSDVVGSRLMLTGKPYTVIGVSQPGFSGLTVGEPTSVFVPVCTGDALDGRTYWWLTVFARTPGRSVEQVNVRLASISRGALEAAAPDRFKDERLAEFMAQKFSARPAAAGVSSARERYSSALLALMAMVGVVLLISCANVANLLLARGAARSREISIRVAIGASRQRLLRQLVTECALLALAGAALGIVLAAWTSKSLIALIGGSDAAFGASLDGRVFAFTAAVSAVTVMLCGFIPAWRATMVDPQSVLKGGGAGRSVTSRLRIGKTLVVAQCALALIVVMAAGLLVGTLERLTSVDTGFDATGVVMATVDLKRERGGLGGNVELQRSLLEGIRAIPGVRSAAIANLTPVGRSRWNTSVLVDGMAPRPERERLTWLNSVSDDYFRTMRTPLVQGREFNPGDSRTAPRVAIVNRSFARRYFTEPSPVGKTFRIDQADGMSAPILVVGLVEDAKYRDLRAEDEPIAYFAAAQDTDGWARPTYVVRADLGVGATVEGVKTVAARVDPAISLRFRTLADQVAESVQRERVLAVLSGFFGAIAFALAMIGLYGVMAYNITRRRVEIGVRIALGAAAPRVVRMVLGEVGRLLAIGVVIGTAGALLVTPLLERFLYGVKPNDALTLGLAVVVLVAGALLAGAIPARRAAALQPVEALRED